MPAALALVVFVLFPLTVAVNATNRPAGDRETPTPASRGLTYRDVVLPCGTSRGPAQPLTFASAPVRAIIPIPNTTGNVTVTFGVPSYAGTVQITVLSDPGRVPDLPVLTAALRRELGSAAR